MWGSASPGGRGTNCSQLENEPDAPEGGKPVGALEFTTVRVEQRQELLQAAAEHGPDLTVITYGHFAVTAKQTSVNF